MVEENDFELRIDGKKVDPDKMPLIDIWQRIFDRMQTKFPGKQIMLNTIDPENDWGDVEVKEETENSKDAFP